MMAFKTTEKTKNNRRLALGHLVEVKGRMVPMRVFLSIIGTTDKSRVTKELIDPLRKAGHNIISLAGTGGYMLMDKVPLEDRIINKLSELKEMVANITDGQTAPIASVPESVPSDKSGKTGSTPKACALDGHLALIAAIVEASKQGRPYTKTGRPGSNGLYVRRMELPGPYNSIGRDRLERIVTELLINDEIGQDKAGFLVVSGS